MSIHRTREDHRYGTQRWAKVARMVRNRDRTCQIVPGCPRPAQVADHIVPSTPEMSDALFFAPANLRGGCQDHNTLRGKAARLEREMGSEKPSAVVTGDYS